MGSLSLIQHQILVGSMLGDGTLRRQGTRTNALLEVNHSLAFKEYVDWKYNHFQDFILTAPKLRLGKGVRVAYRFTTRSLPEFTNYYLQYYAFGSKRIPFDITLTPLSLAVWFMDDGSNIRSSFYLNTQQFTLSEQVLLQYALREKFNIKGKLNRDKTYWRLRINTEDTKKMRSIIEPFILPCFSYKLKI